MRLIPLNETVDPWPVKEYDDVIGFYFRLFSFNQDSQLIYGNIMTGLFVFLMASLARLV